MCIAAKLKNQMKSTDVDWGAAKLHTIMLGFSRERQRNARRSAQCQANEKGDHAMTASESEPFAMTTRERVLDAAATQFLSQPYDKATLRKIACDAGVDVAYVHRLFGSKRALFGEVLSTIFERETPLWPLARDVSGSFAVTESVGKGALGFQGMDPIDLLIYSLGDPDARAAIVDFLGYRVIDPLEASFEGEDGRRRAEQILAFLIGARIMRRFIGLKSLEGNGSDEWREWLTTTIECISGD